MRVLDIAYSSTGYRVGGYLIDEHADVHVQPVLELCHTLSQYRTLSAIRHLSTGVRPCAMSVPGMLAPYSMSVPGIAKRARRLLPAPDCSTIALAT
eukprot:3670474-Rhodomonas_salina.2